MSNVVQLSQRRGVPEEPPVRVVVKCGDAEILGLTVNVDGAKQKWPSKKDFPLAQEAIDAVAAWLIAHAGH